MLIVELDAIDSDVILSIKQANLGQDVSEANDLITRFWANSFC
jgi:hypothetical protein